MKTIEIKLYKFSELSENAKQKAIEKFAEVNTDYEWYESIIEDAKNIGLRISEFELYNSHKIDGTFISSAYECANAIAKEHGEVCETHKSAKLFIEDYNKLVEKFSDGINKEQVTEENEYDFDNWLDEKEEDFLQLILEDYLTILQNEYEYQQSDKAIIETIEANDYDFTEDGKLY